MMSTRGLLCMLEATCTWDSACKQSLSGRQGSTWAPSSLGDPVTSETQAALFS